MIGWKHGGVRAKCKHEVLGKLVPSGSGGQDFERRRGRRKKNVDWSLGLRASELKREKFLKNIQGSLVRLCERVKKDDCRVGCLLGKFRFSIGADMEAWVLLTWRDGRAISGRSRRLRVYETNNTFHIKKLILIFYKIGLRKSYIFPITPQNTSFFYYLFI